MLSLAGASGFKGGGGWLKKTTGAPLRGASVEDPFLLLRKTMLPGKMNECLKSLPREGLSGSICADKGENHEKSAS